MYLAGLMPELIWVEPYDTHSPLPPNNTNWGQISILHISDRGWSQRRKNPDYDATTNKITNYYDVQRIYSVQIDFYGPDAMENALRYKQFLQVGLSTEYGIADLKVMSEVRCLTELLENTEYIQRFNFDVDVYVVDTITKTTDAIDNAQITIVNRGNNP